MGHHYMPVLLGRLGEYSALKELKDTEKLRLTPLIEVPPVPWDFSNDQPAAPVREHVSGTADKIAEYWGGRRCMVDLPWLTQERLDDDSHAVELVFRECRSEDVAAVPVTGPSRVRSYQEAVRSIVRTDARGVCIRVEPDDLDNPFTLDAELQELLQFLNVERSDCDLVIDFKGLSGPAGPLVLAVSSLLGVLGSLNEWRTLTWAGTAFPENLAGVPSGTVQEITRVEWDVWSTLANRRAAPRIPSFGDYCIAYPEPAEIDPRLMRMSANLRYTARAPYGTWLILKGRNVRDHGFEQFYSLCRLLVQRPEFDGEGKGAGWADDYIEKCARQEVGPGNATTWRRVGTNRHINAVLADLANMNGS